MTLLLSMSVEDFNVRISAFFRVATPANAVRLVK
jgi:hypothetical protein